MSRPLAITAAVAALLALTGCAGAAAPAPSEPAPSFTAAPSASAPTDPTAEPSASADPLVMTDDWLEHASSDGSVSFRYPPTWTLEADSEPFSPGGSADPQSPERWVDSATLTAPNGQQLLAMHDFVDIGGSCGGFTFPLEVLATEPARAEPLTTDDGDPVIATVALGTDDDRWRVGVGITSSGSIERAEACHVYFVGSSSDGGVSFGTHFQLSSAGDDPLWTVDSLDDARAYMETDEYATIIEILRSFETS